MTKRISRLAVALLCCALAACNTDIKETLGLNHKGPDAMDVYSRPPLTVPPDFDLQSPGKGPEYSVGVPTDVQAHNDIFGNSGPNATNTPASKQLPSMHLLNSPLSGPATTAVPSVSSGPLPSNGDAQFLSNIGAAKADSNVREEIDKDKAAGAVAPKDDHYFFSGSSTAEPTVDSAKEAQRLKDDKAQDKSPTTGETPVIVPKDKGLLGDIF